MDIVDIIKNKPYDKAAKIIRLWCIAQLNYRQPLGDDAWDAIEELTDKDTVTALAFLTGFSMGATIGNGSYGKKLEELVPELKEADHVAA